MNALRSWRIRLLTVALPALLAGSFEFVRHSLEAFTHIPVAVGNLVTAGLALLGGLVYFQTTYALVARLTADAERARAERAAFLQRQQVADELHDSVSQTLFFLNVRLRSALERVRRLDDPELAAAITEAAEAAQDTYLQVRDSIRRLGRADGDRADDAREAWEGLVEGVLAGSGLRVSMAAQAGAPRFLDPPAQAALRGILLEALRNVRKHAAATAVRVWLAEDAGGGRAGVEDDGRGFAPGQGEGYGLPAIRRRAAAAGLRLEIASAPGEGARVEVRWPREGRVVGADTVPDAARR